jgi:histidine phosphotransferase ChpT
MDIQLDSRVTELLCARLCHDLIGPIAAVNNGVELVRDYGDEMQGEALALIGESANKASQLLQFYRVA